MDRHAQNIITSYLNQVSCNDGGRGIVVGFLLWGDRLVSWLLMTCSFLIILLSAWHWDEVQVIHLLRALKKKNLLYRAKIRENRGQEWQHDLLTAKVAKGLHPRSPRSQNPTHSTTPHSFSPTVATLRGGRSKSSQSGQSKGARKRRNGAAESTWLATPLPSHPPPSPLPPSPLPRASSTRCQPRHVTFTRPQRSPC